MEIPEVQLPQQLSQLPKVGVYCDTIGEGHDEDGVNRDLLMLVSHHEKHSLLSQVHALQIRTAPPWPG